MDDISLWWCCLTNEVRELFFYVWIDYSPTGGSYITRERYDALLFGYGHLPGSLDYNVFLSMAMLSIGEIGFPSGEIIDVFFFNEPRALAMWSWLPFHSTVCLQKCRLLTFPA